MTRDIGISERLDLLAAQAAQTTEGNGDREDGSVTLAWILEQLNERAFGLFLVILALPCCIPFLYGVPQVVSVPLMFVSLQLLVGRSTPWLPARFAARTISVQTLRSLSDRAGPWLRKLELFSRPRMTALTRPPAERIVGGALVLFSASILVPLPLTNSVPAVAVAIIAGALLQRDGLFVLLGMLLGTAWIASLIFAGASLISLIRTWLGM
ncbi:MAG: exopolysaccharide biosynthesis protein [Pseudomonadota bacterium]